jgi:hypothetical protein
VSSVSTANLPGREPPLLTLSSQGVATVCPGGSSQAPTHPPRRHGSVRLTGMQPRVLGAARSRPPVVQLASAENGPHCSTLLRVSGIADPGPGSHTRGSGACENRVEGKHRLSPRDGLADVWQARHVNGTTGHTTQLTTHPIDELHFDPQNPRIPEGVDGTSDEQVLRWMLSDATLLDLMGSIAEHGYFAGEPLLLAPREPEGYTVVEGNRRLAAVRLLLHPEQAPLRQSSVQQLADSAPNKPTHVYGVLFPDRDSILDYLGSAILRV